jgi:uncharacterized protein YrzB (UPF0473 family)
MKIINAKAVVDYNKENGGFYTITFLSENNGHFTICRDFDEEDEKIYFEIDDQINASYIFPQDVKYNLENGSIDFMFNNNTKPNTNIANHTVVKFPIVQKEQFDMIKKTLEKIWTN